MELFGAAALSIMLLVSGSGGRLAATTAATAPPSVENAMGQAQAWGLAEIDLLAELDAFSHNDLVTEIYDSYPSPDLTEAGLLEALRVTEQQNVRILAALDAEGAPLSADARLLLGPLPGGAYGRVTSAETGFLDPAAYLNGLMDLLVRDGAAPAGSRRASDRQALADYLDAMGPSPLERIATPENTNRTNATAGATTDGQIAEIGAAGTGNVVDATNGSGSATTPLLVGGGIGLAVLGLGGVPPAPPSTHEPRSRLDPGSHSHRRRGSGRRTRRARSGRRARHESTHDQGARCRRRAADRRDRLPAPHRW
jgi:hypothetical protein